MGRGEAWSGMEWDERLWMGQDGQARVKEVRPDKGRTGRVRSLKVAVVAKHAGDIQSEKRREP